MKGRPRLDGQQLGQEGLGAGEAAPATPGRSARESGCATRRRGPPSAPASRPAADRAPGAGRTPRLHDDLVKVHPFGERLEGLAAAGVGPGHPQAGADLELEDPDAGRPRAGHRGGRVLELHRGVAGVQAQAHVPAQGRLGARRPAGRWLPRTPPAPPPRRRAPRRKVTPPAGGLEQALGLRLEGQADAGAARLAQIRQRVAACRASCAPMRAGGAVRLGPGPEAARAPCSPSPASLRAAGSWSSRPATRSL